MAEWWASTTASFGYWVRRQRKALDLTQPALADRVGCALSTIKKIEADERRPSRQVAERLAECLGLPAGQRRVFVECARGRRSVDRLSLAREPLAAPTPGRRVSLPLDPLPFVGRGAELARIAACLGRDDCRLLTVVGMGGVGKTRLAVRAAAMVAGRFAHGACYVPLAAVAAPDHLAAAVLRRLDVPPSGALDAEAQLVAVLRDRELLLVLDNFEPLLAGDGAADASAALLGRILGTCPGVELLVTSRERLNLRAEWLLPLAGLPVADEAVALFVQGARRVRPSFAPDGQEGAIADICRSVEGLPLAVELAAGLTEVLSCAQIADRVRRGADLPATRLRDVPERHRSLRALFDRSWDLLSDEEGDLWMRLAVFRGGFTADEAAAVGGAEPPALLGLVQKSLVRSDGRGRYDLHELVRRYAAERLAGSGALPQLQERHFRAYLSLAETAAAHFAGPAAIRWFDRLEAEQANLDAALDWALDHADDRTLIRLTLPLAGGYWPDGLWRQGGNWREGADRVRRVLARLPEADSPERVLLLLDYAAFLARSGRPRDAKPHTREAYALAQRIGDPHALGVAATVMSMAVPAERQRFARQAIGLLRRVAGPPVLAGALWIWGDERRSRGALDEARAAYEESLLILRGVGNLTHIVYPLGRLGRLALSDGDLAGARRVFAECVDVCRRTRNRVGLADWLLALGVVRLYQGEPGPARAALQESLAVSEEIAHRPLVPNILTWLALAAVAEEDLDQAGRCLQQSLGAYTAFYAADGSHLSTGDLQYMERSHLIEALLAAVRIQAAREHLASAASLLSFTQQLLSEQHDRLDPPLQAMVDDVHARLDLPALATAWADGRALTPEEALALAVG